ncbi:ASCH domain-containing protein [Paenibacillus sp.]|jgi:hypothetical protein|uniref:ASCH domain-containing protein n=1 Tax=Paenibacillus sp. TaxID=58172 RepID=UPI0028269B6A|nr:ASCH domain-containing protein [Paenibacillus sp.]MDR0269614.1 ASCH domain-containing protein [Paenibacillus sp.]
MKAITIIQPWATLIALGEKQFETCSWRTNYRGELAIHAGKKVDREACRTEPICSTLEKYGYTEDNLPTGAIVAIVTLKDCLQSVDTWTDGYVLENGSYVYPPEYELGDFTPGRYGWQLSNNRWLPEPIPAKGMQGLWNWEGLN